MIAFDAHDRHVVVVCGLAFEAKIAAGKDVAVVCTGDRRQLGPMLRETLTKTTCGILSFGCAAGLAPELQPGACIVARSVLSPADVFATDPQWSERMLAALSSAVHAGIAGVEHPVELASQKCELHARSGAVVADMESHIVGRIARERGLPFAALRVVLDPAERPVPRAAIAGHRTDGTTDALAVLAALCRRPGDLPAVIRLALDFRIAVRALLRCRRQLGERFAFMDIGHHPLDVA